MIALVLKSLVVVLALEILCVSGGLVGSAVIPHGDFALDPELLPNGSTARTEAESIRAAARRLSGKLKESNPEVLVLVTPHGQAVTSEFAVYLNDAVEGFAKLGADLHNKTSKEHEVSVHRRVNQTFAQMLLDSDACQGRCTGLTSFEGSEPQPIRWGEVVPLALLSELSHVPIVILSVPSTRHVSTASMFEDLQAFGSDLGLSLGDIPLRIALVMSSDLAHTHSASGPYGFSESAKPFDEAIGTWARAPWSKQGDLALQKANSLVDKALSCGFPSIVLLDAILRSLNSPWQSVDVALAAPTYYGMLVAGFFPSSSFPLPSSFSVQLS